MTRRRLALLLLAGFLLLTGAVGGVVRRGLSPAASGAPELLFVVSPGESLAQIAANLETQGLVRRAVAVEWLARLLGVSSELRSGEYLLSASMTPKQILEHIARGEVLTYEIVIPEGLRAVEIAERLEAEGLAEAESLLQVIRDPQVVADLGLEGETLEGYLFPETYRIPRGLAPRQIARILVEQFRAVWGEIEPQARAHDLSMRDAVTLASIVEKETGAEEERPLIASVFHNRLRRNMRLESDPTVIYGLADFDGNLRRADLENAENPYNTYRIKGLPPGPIASPGADALRAVVSPADTDYLYFVSRNDGTHSFSRTYREHALAVNKYQRKRGSR